MPRNRTNDAEFRADAHPAGSERLQDVRGPQGRFRRVRRSARKQRCRQEQSVRCHPVALRLGGARRERGGEAASRRAPRTLSKHAQRLGSKDRYRGGGARGSVRDRFLRQSSGADAHPNTLRTFHREARDQAGHRSPLCGGRERVPLAGQRGRLGQAHSPVPERKVALPQIQHAQDSLAGDRGRRCRARLLHSSGRQAGKGSPGACRGSYRALQHHQQCGVSSPLRLARGDDRVAAASARSDTPARAFAGHGVGRARGRWFQPGGGTRNHSRRDDV